MPDHRHAGLLPHARDQTLAAARHDDVDIVDHFREHVPHRRAIGGRDQLNAAAGQAGDGQPLLQTRVDGRAGVGAFRTAAQDHGVARFQAQRARIGGDIRSAFINDADDAERHPLGAESACRWGASTRASTVPMGSASRSMSSSPRAMASTRFSSSLRRSSRAARQPLRGCGLHVSVVGGEDLVAARAQRSRGGPQGAVLLIGGGDAQGQRGRTRGGTDAVHEFRHRLGERGSSSKRLYDWVHTGKALNNTRSSRCTISSRPRNPSTFSISADLRPMMRAASPSE